ncbi:MAG: polysaccharide deacetylase family protein [Ruminococcaceae bacterium]|nr:polysaccharide deacetylase family protein [Oscillospiraceae bacterium]
MKKALSFPCILAAILFLLSVGCGAFYDGEVFSSCYTNESKKIALTFDDGPHPRYTPEILSILDEYGVKATFFVVGQNVDYYPDLVKAEVDGGHEVGNHTFSHANLRREQYEAVCAEITRTERLIFENTDFRSRLLRPPEGVYSQAVCDAAADHDYTIVLWSIDTKDWEHTPSEKIAEQVISEVRGGDIILFHDFIGHDSPTPEALRVILPKLIEDGYKFVTVSELLSSK